VVRNLSHGQRMRMDIALACLHKPILLFLDEPTIALDSDTQRTVRRFLKTINQEWRTTIVLASNDLDDVNSVCNDILLLKETRPLFFGSIPKTTNLDQFIGNVLQNDIK